MYSIPSSGSWVEIVGEASTPANSILPADMKTNIVIASHVVIVNVIHAVNMHLLVSFAACEVGSVVALLLDLVSTAINIYLIVN